MNYYAVRKGWRRGIFDNWEETKAATDKYSGAEFKKFTKLTDAVSYLLHGTEESRLSQIERENCLHVTIDGSYNDKTEEAGWAYVISVGDNKENIIAQDSGKRSIPSNGIRNIAGEIIAAQEGIKKALELVEEGQPVVVQYDYEGLRHWITGHWKAKATLAKEYMEQILPFYQQGKIIFTHVEAHKHWANRIVDNLAREACGCKRR